MRCILTTIFEIFICCTLYKLFTVVEHAKSSRGRTQVEMLVLVSNMLKKKKKKLFIFTSNICIICILLQIISSSCVIYRPAA